MTLHPAAQTAAILGVIALLMMVKPCEAQDVKYCINHETQEIYTVPANAACPYPTVEL